MNSKVLVRIWGGWKIIGLLLCAFLLAACERGPGSDQLQQTITQKINQRLGENALEIVSFDRRGSNANHTGAAGEERRTVYFNIVLRVKRDINFGDWGSNDAAALANILGTGKRGIQGIQARGNVAGDMIRARGAAVFTLADGEWKYLSSAVVEPTVKDSPMAGTIAFESTVQSLSRFMDSLPEDVKSRHPEVFEQQMLLAQARILGQLAQREQKIALASGPIQGEYYALARAIQQLNLGTTPEEFPRWIPVQTTGSTDNIRLLREGSVSAAFAQVDTALAAFQGQGVFASEGSFSTLRQVVELYPEYLHILVRADSPITGIDQLKGKKIALGALDSAAYQTGSRVLAAYGIEFESIRETNLQKNLQNLENGTIDAVIHVIGLPAQVLDPAFLQSKVRLLSIESAVLDKLLADHIGYRKGRIEPESYPTQKTAVETLIIPAALYVRESTPDSVISQILQDVVLSKHDYAAAGSLMGSYIHLEHTKESPKIPSHRAVIQPNAQP